jgi:hypothetical protein
MSQVTTLVLAIWLHSSSVPARYGADLDIALAAEVHRCVDKVTHACLTRPQVASPLQDLSTVGSFTEFAG